MRKVLSLGLVAFALAGCNPDPNVASPNQVVIAINTYNAAVATGQNYLALPLCAPALVFPCRTPGLSQQVYTSLKAGRVARKRLLAALSANSAAPLTAIQTLEAAYSVIQSIPKQ